MKKMIVTMLMSLLATSAFAGTGQIGSGALGLSKKDFLNSYIVAKLAVEGPYYVAQFEVNDTGDAVTFRDANIEKARQNGDCTGSTFNLDQNILRVGVVCKSLGNKPLNFEINVSGLSAADLVKGATVQARSEATGGQWYPFTIYKKSTSFFQ